MDDKSIETISFEDSVVIEEPTFSLSSFYSLFKRGSNTGDYIGFCLFLCILPIILPYVFYGSYFNLYLIGLGLLAIDTFYLANSRKSSILRVGIFNCAFGYGFRLFAEENNTGFEQTNCDL